MLEAECSNLQFAKVVRKASAEDIMFFAICTNAYFRRAFRAIMTGCSTRRAECSGSAMLNRVAQAPALLALRVTKKWN